MLTINYNTQFKKDYKKAVKRGLDIKEHENVIFLLATEQKLPDKFRDHALADSRNYKGMRECHIESDWLLVYQIIKSELILNLVRTGSHSDLF